MERPYWSVLFGNLDSIIFDRVTKMLKMKTVTYKDVRIKYAWLALVSGGRLAFNMTMSSVKARNEIELSQNTLAIKGFTFALLLVLVITILALVVYVLPGGVVSSDSETEGDNDADNETENDVNKDEAGPKMRVPPIHVRLLCESDNVEVECIISGEPDGPLDVTWDVDVAEETVDTLVELINKNHEKHFIWWANS
ncbi:unnamed protein product [Arabis nemorensis]|uniref:Uncharacterized protein n=1 Tax=Arabis nemorensis TaxID=586526 RepID=A0A565BTL5_9BRAS|nr:unnamed protein product [Arabis nemorensis]